MLERDRQKSEKQVPHNASKYSKNPFCILIIGESGAQLNKILNDLTNVNRKKNLKHCGQENHEDNYYK